MPPKSKFIGFVGDRIMGVDPTAILNEDSFWNWKKGKVVKNIVKLTNFFDVMTNGGLMYIPKQDDTLEDVDTPT